MSFRSESACTLKQERSTKRHRKKSFTKSEALLSRRFVRRGAGGRGRTDTVSLPRDFESVLSMISLNYLALSDIIYYPLETAYLCGLFHI